jgi:hypothetical protein
VEEDIRRVRETRHRPHCFRKLVLTDWLLQEREEAARAITTAVVDVHNTMKVRVTA